MDFVTAAQAAHWFDLPRARAEFVRIMKPDGWCILIWNERRTDRTPFLREYEQMLLDIRHGLQRGASRADHGDHSRLFRAQALPGTRLRPAGSDSTIKERPGGCFRPPMRRSKAIRTMRR